MEPSDDIQEVTPHTTNRREMLRRAALTGVVAYSAPAVLGTMHASDAHAAGSAPPCTSSLTVGATYTLIATDSVSNQISDTFTWSGTSFTETGGAGISITAVVITGDAITFVVSGVGASFFGFPQFDKSYTGSAVNCTTTTQSAHCGTCFAGTFPDSQTTTGTFTLTH